MSFEKTETRKKQYNIISKFLDERERETRERERENERGTTRKKQKR